jgi:hypothetical protein
VSPSIDVDYVEAVLLADGWHHVNPRSFTLDAYQFVTATEAQAEDGSFDVVYPSPSGTPPLGFAFTEQDSLTGELRRVGGPLTSILATRFSVREVEDDGDDGRAMTTYGGS